MKGFIFVNRDIVEHWIWKNPRHFKWWMHLIICAAYEPTTVVYGKETYILERGQLATTIRQLCGVWECYSEAVLSFLRVLESHGMITRKITAKMTVITLVNYDKYQSGLGASERKPSRKPKHLKEDNKEEEINKTTLSPSAEQDLKFFEELSQDTTFWEEAAKNFKITIQTLKTLADEFFSQMKLTAKYHSSSADFRQHFFNWAKLKIRNNGGAKKINLNGTQNQRAARRASDVQVAPPGTDDSTF